jgi:hypothetical protein
VGFGAIYPDLATLTVCAMLALAPPESFIEVVLYNLMKDQKLQHQD